MWPFFIFRPPYNHCYLKKFVLVAFTLFECNFFRVSEKCLLVFFFLKHDYLCKIWSSLILISFLSLTGSLTGTKPACLFGGFRSRSTSCSSSAFCLASALLPCSLCQLSVVRVSLISFSSLTGTKPACLTGGFRSRATICSTTFFFLWKLVYECCTLGIHL